MVVSQDTHPALEERTLGDELQLRARPEQELVPKFDELVLLGFRSLTPFGSYDRVTDVAGSNRRGRGTLHTISIGVYEDQLEKLEVVQLITGASKGHQIRECIDEWFRKYGISERPDSAGQETSPSDR